MKVPSTRAILVVLSRKRLLRIADEAGVRVDRKAPAEVLVAVLAAEDSLQARELVELLTVGEWLALCRACEVEDQASARGRRQVPARAKILQLDVGDDRVTKPPTPASSPAAAAAPVRLTVLSSAPSCSCGSLERRRRARRARLYQEQAQQRPLTRAECVDGPRPCPWTSCTHHLVNLAPRDAMTARHRAAAVRYAEEHGMGRAAEEFGVHPATIRAWRDEPAEPEALPAPRSLMGKESCALDVADRGGATLGEIGVAIGVTQERVRQIEGKALRKPGVRQALEEFAAP